MTLVMFREKIVVPVEKFLAYSDETKRLIVAGEATATILDKKIVFTVIQESARNILGISLEG